MIIEFNVLDRQYKMYEDEYNQAAIRVLKSGWYILGKELGAFETQFSKYCGSPYCVGLNSGLDALILAFRALGIGAGDEVIVPANTYIASVLAITENGAKPIFIEPDEFYNIDADKIEIAITNKTKAILPVHLYGQTCNMVKIMEIAKNYNLNVVEDCAQSHDACFDGKMSGTYGIIGCFSFYPTKNLGAFGDSGAIVTDNCNLEEKIRLMRNYGSKIKYQNELEGINSRLDEMQAALLNVKLSHLKNLTAERKRIASQYLKGIENPKITLPKNRDKADHVYHMFIIRCKCRDLLQKYLFDNGIKTQIHYPIPPHLAECYERLGFITGDFPITEQYSNEVLSLPLYNGMTDEEIEYVIDIVNKYE